MDTDNGFIRPKGGDVYEDWNKGIRRGGETFTGWADFIEGARVI